LSRYIYIIARYLDNYTTMVKKGNISIGLSISEDLFNKFRRFLAAKYGVVQRGLISCEVELALESYMADYRSHTHKTQTNLLVAPNPTPFVFQVREDVKKYMREKLGYEVVYQVPLRHVQEAIAMVRGSDKRTINKWLKTFQKYKILKFISVNQVEFL